MREPPPHVSDDDVLVLLRSSWDRDLASVTHLPVGFGAHHWRADAEGTPRFFVTLDLPDERKTASELEASYAAAAQLAASGLEFVVPSLPSVTGSFTVPCADGDLSVTAWRDGTSHGFGPPETREAAEATLAMLRRLHATAPPPGLAPWRPVIDRAFSARLALRLGTPWDTGPYGERARAALSRHVEDIGRWSAAYLRLCDAAVDRPWGATHGEPHQGNQLVTPTGRVLVDWETARRAPAERDLRVLVEGGFADLCGDAIDWEMVEMYDLEWRLDEISQYADWFSAPHDGTKDDEIAYGGLLGELDRADFAVEA
ncbi:phosphotransferase [Nocardioides bigeumensis]|uniref:Aminoglycoside phosphotransferase domain-containing protein n=1 Tax=Nocardioides bigeumensis TaxID=433657 RepID=A0ABP5J9E4_9ACTN